MSVTENIKAYMKEKGIKQTYLGKRMGYSDKKISIVLSNDKNFKVIDYLAICLALGVQPPIFLPCNSEKLGSDIEITL